MSDRIGQAGARAYAFPARSGEGEARGNMSTREPPRFGQHGTQEDSRRSKHGSLGLAIGGPAPARKVEYAEAPAPQFSAEESILLRNLAGGSSIKEISGQLRLSKGNLYRLLSDLRRKTGTTDDLELSVWVLRNLRGRAGDSRGISR
jgi:DNA-binding CsgD family transcriptional regulator